MRESIGDSGRELLVDAAASAQRARGERNGNDDGKMADADWHVRGVAIVGDGFASGFSFGAGFIPDGFAVYGSRRLVLVVRNAFLKKVKLAYVDLIGIMAPERLRRLLARSRTTLQPAARSHGANRRN